MRMTTRMKVKKANAGEFYRADLSHTVKVLGAAMRSLERMERYDLVETIDTIYWNLDEELFELREEEKRERETKQS